MIRLALDYAKSSKAKMGADEPKSCSDALFGRRARKIGFIFIILFLTALTMKDVKELVEEYLEWPKESDINIVFNESMSMPNITFCMSRPQAWSHFKLNESAPADEWDMVVDENLANMTTHDSFLNTLWDYRMVMEAYDMIATYNSLERETTAHGSARSINVFRVSPRLAAKRKTFKKWHEVLADRDVTFEELTQKVGTEVLRRSMQRFQRTTFDENLIIKTRLRTSWISMMQLCFQPMFDADNLHPIEDQGNFFTMLLSHNAENLNNKSVDCMSVDFHGRPSSLNRFMEGKGRARDGYIDELCLGQRHEVTVHVTNLYQMLENDDEGTACRDVEEDEDSEFDCRSRCRMEMIRDMCNCTGQSLAYLVDDDDELKKFPLCDYTQCVVDVQQGNYSDSECSAKCYHDCRQIRYEVDHAVKGRMVRPDLTMVELNWGSFEYLTMEQQWKYTVSSFIAALGGAIGMWLGLSILSLIQLGSYCYTYLKNRFAKSKVGDADEGSADIEVDVGGTKKKMSMAENPFESPFGSGSPPPVKKSSNTRRASGDQGSVGYSSNPNGSSTVKIN